MYKSLLQFCDKALASKTLNNYFEIASTISLGYQEMKI